MARQETKPPGNKGNKGWKILSGIILFIWVSGSLCTAILAGIFAESQNYTSSAEAYLKFLESCIFLVKVCCNPLLALAPVLAVKLGVNVFRLITKEQEKRISDLRSNIDALSNQVDALSSHTRLSGPKGSSQFLSPPRQSFTQTASPKRSSHVSFSPRPSRTPPRFSSHTVKSAQLPPFASVVEADVELGESPL